MTRQHASFDVNLAPAARVFFRQADTSLQRRLDGCFEVRSLRDRKRIHQAGLSHHDIMAVRCARDQGTRERRVLVSARSCRRAGVLDPPNLLCNNFRMPRFRWNDWNTEHIARHGVTPAEAEAVVVSGSIRRSGTGKYKAIGRSSGGRWIQAVYVFDPPGVVYVIHARPLTNSEKRRARRKLR